MRIISKYKDYYDWVIFETDNRKVFNRIESKILDKNYYVARWDKTEKYFGCLYFCNKKYKFLTIDNQYYWIESDLPQDVIKLINKERNIFDSKELKWMDLGLAVSKKTQEPIHYDLNLKLGTPIILSYGGTFNLNPKLSDIGFNKVVLPIEAYQEIYNWIPYIEPELPGPPEDMDRYEAKGFDKKTSFRPKMK